MKVKIFIKLLQNKKKYLSLQTQKGTGEFTYDKNGAVVQLVRIHACHAWGRGFESRPHRERKSSDSVESQSFFIIKLNIFFRSGYLIFCSFCGNGLQNSLLTTLSLINFILVKFLLIF